jgi:archaeosine synthase alpha-subunit
MRTADRFEGMALLGAGSAGPLPFALPALIESGPAENAGPGLTLATLAASSGTRRLRLADGKAELVLELPILAPEIAGVGTGVHRVNDRTYLLHAPVLDAALGEIRSSAPELVVLGNARALWNEGEPLIAALRAIRASLGAGPVVWAPRVALPHRLPFLVYAGIDLVDTTEGELAAARGEYLDPTLARLDPAAARAERSCSCDGCRGGNGNPDLALHARFAYRRALAETRVALRTGRLRELVESRLSSEPALSELLRYVDRDLGPLLEGRAPVTGTRPHDYVLAESHRRPEMVRFRRRLLDRYRPPASKSVLLLVPCSKTKPYRRSHSHRRFAAALDGLPDLARVHVVSLSSPIGVVPRELEDVPPARHYDIPVTGDWSGNEQEAVGEGVDHLLRNGRYTAVVAHLDPAEYSFVRARLPSTLPTVWTMGDGASTARPALDALRTAVSAALASAPPLAGGPLAVVAQELREAASFQFGRAAADRLFAPPVRLAGRPWFQRVTDGRNDLATLHEERGLFHLTVLGARRLGELLPRVEVDPAVRLEGDLFVPGVRSADPAIRAGDEVGLFRDGRLAAIGEAALPGRLMGELGRGLAVRVRKRDHAETDTHLTGEGSGSAGGPVVEG